MFDVWNGQMGHISFFSFRAGITCDDTKYAEILMAPSYDN